MVSSRTVWLSGLISLSLWCPSGLADYVIPAMGGGQVEMDAAPMIHTDITFENGNIGLTIDTSEGIPVLRPLTLPDEFDPAMPWAVLSGKAYNFQLAWNAGGYITIPPGAGIWVEQTSASPGLEVYQRPPASPSYKPIFGTAGSPRIWKWSGAMSHNAYAVRGPLRRSYFAEYKVYIGDAETGVEVLNVQGNPAYGSASIRWTWNTGLADYERDGDCDLADFGHLQGCFNGPNRPPALTTCWDADADTDGDVDLSDFGLFQGCFNGPNRPMACP